MLFSPALNISIIGSFQPYRHIFSVTKQCPFPQRGTSPTTRPSARCVEPDTEYPLCLIALICITIAMCQLSSVSGSSLALARANPARNRWWRTHCTRWCCRTTTWVSPPPLTTARQSSTPAISTVCESSVFCGDSIRVVLAERPSPLGSDVCKHEAATSCMQDL